MFRLAVLVAVIIIGYMAARYIRTLKPEQRKKVTAITVAVVLITLLLLLLITGKLHFLAALGTGLVIFAKRLFPLLRYVPFLKGLYQKAKATQSSDSSQRSTVETSLLKMTLDHESGNLEGELLATDSKGRYLSEFNLSELISLYGLAEKQYPDSTEVLAAYLDRQHGNEWREAANAGSYSEENGQDSRPSDSSEMTANEAYAVLGLDQNATEEEVIAAHRKLMQKLHPDRGGSNYLAAKINQAKDLLVSRKGK
ncbi:MAG: DnaJ-domain-containing protein 1 [Oleispira sp.]|jgi:DnaJ-domain-containing protein 1